ncbi:MAG: hypothetical protein JNK82_14200 [Myxococcaceae bacterium]|nr:hypothetical protein [Myxococcaceae bacterium]
MACGTTGGGGAGGGSGTAGSGTGGGSGSAGSGEFGLCSAANKCPSGQFCFNGVCAIGCQSNGDCATDQYCDTMDLGPPFFCKNKTVSTCPTVACAENQECKNGLCAAKPAPNAPACMPRPDGMDGCDKYSLCLPGDNGGDAVCYGFPACAQDGSCPTGLVGAVCNAGYIPNKGRMCLTGACRDATHCPSQWKCVRDTTDVLGSCSAGRVNDFCLVDADCQSNICYSAGGPGFPALCSSGAPNQPCRENGDCASGSCDQPGGPAFPGFCN